MAIRIPSVQDLSIRQLQYIVAVADTLGFRKAAELCRVSQPSLSTQVKELEEVLGVQLFERDRRTVMLTQAGQTVVGRARRVLVELEDLVNAAARSRDPFVGTLRIGVIPTIAPYLLPEVTPAVSAKYPRLRLVFREEKTEDIVKDLEQGQLDAGLLALEAEVGDVAHAEVLKDPFVVALPPTHALAKKKRLTISDLEDLPVLLLDDGHCFREQALSVCSKAGVEEADFRATSLATLAQMVSAGAGATLLPALALDVENRRGQLAIRPLAAPAPSRTIALVWRPSSALGPALTELAGVLKTAAKSGQRR